jgi:membrane fusion protein, multidrug efflux system
MADTALPSATAQRNRMKWLVIAGGIFVVAGLFYAAYWFVALRHFEQTDDAYVQGNLVQITPQVPGTVVAVNADDTDLVKAGSPLIALDRADAEVALAQAQAALAQTVREVRSFYSANSTGEANVTLRQAEVARARADLAKAEDDLARRQGLTASGAVSGEELNHAQSGVSNASAALAANQAALVAAQQQLAMSQNMTDGATVQTHPNVERAAAKVRAQYLDYARTVLPAPVSGYVARRTVQVGQRVAPGAPLMAIVPLDQVWVDANFKEVQLRNMRIGQPVTLTADAYGKAIEYHGTVVGVGVGTGSAFALLPAQNATGNWIKVVQRVPVRIALDPKELADHPLRVGLSMEVSVDVADTRGGTLAKVTRSDTAHTTDAFERDAQQADALVRDTIASNMGRGKATGSLTPGGLAKGAAPTLALPAMPSKAPNAPL